MATYVHLLQYLAEFFLEWEIFQTKLVEKISTHAQLIFSTENPVVYEMMSKNVV